MSILEYLTGKKTITVLELATKLAAYKAELIKQGFSPEAAFELVLDYQRLLLGGN